MANKLVKGTVILSIATLFTKIIGALFWAPFQNIAGDETVGLYRISFPFYTILLMIASAGIPITVSKFVAERLARNDQYGARRVLKAASFILTLSGLIAFSILFFGARFISHVLLNNPPTESSLKVLAFAILIVPIMAVYRGYFQGHQQMMPTGISQVVEQILRVGVVIGLTYWMVKSHFSRELVAAGATFGAFAGALGGLLVVLWYNRKDLRQIKKMAPPKDTKSREPLSKLARQIIVYALPISLGTLILPLISLIDSFTVPRLLMNLGNTQSMANTLFGIYGRGEPFVNVISTFSSALTLALIPSISAHIARHEMAAVKHKIKQAWLMTLVVSMPSVMGLVILARPLNILMFENDHGTLTLSVLACSSIFSTLAVTSSGILQGMGYNKLPVRHLMIGAAVKLAGNFVFIPWFGITGSAMSMVTAYIVVCTLNMWMVIKKTGLRLDVTRQFAKPAISVGLMGIILMSVYLFITQWFDPLQISRAGNGILSISLVLFAVIVYGIVLLLTRTIGENEIRLLPRGTRVLAVLKKAGLVKPANQELTT
ncbi:MAG: polysaccharide biosynthesis protein [Thermoactinomyces sp.]